MINVDFCVPGHLTRKQIDLSSLIRPWGPSYGGPGANYISVVLSNGHLEDLLKKLVEHKVAIRVLVRTLSADQSDESLLVWVDPPDSCSPLRCSTCHAVGHIALTCARKVDPPMCYACGDEGHTSSDATCVMWSSMETCVACGMVGHEYYVCQEGNDAS